MYKSLNQKKYNQSEKGKAVRKNWELNNRDKVLAGKRRFYQRHKEEIRIKCKKQYQDNPEFYRAISRDYVSRNLDKVKASNIRRSLEVKTEVITHYGNGKCACVNCGFKDIRALSIDHINGGGNQERKRFNISGKGMYYWLKKNNLPIGYQTLCMNCQFIKRMTLDENRQGRANKRKQTSQ